ncbi:MAG: lipase family protein [Bdellovibrionota bacterium]
MLGLLELRAGVPVGFMAMEGGVMQFLLKYFPGVLTVSVLSLGVAHANQIPDDVEDNILPIGRILREARVNEAKNPLDQQEVGSGLQNKSFLTNRTRVYTVSPLGLTQLGLSSKALESESTIMAREMQLEADANDGHDTTAFDEVGSPLDAQHLSEFRICPGTRTEQGLTEANVYWMSVMTSIAYLKYPLAFDRLKYMGFDQIYFVEGPSDVEVFVAKILPKKDAKGNYIKDSGLSIVAFRGTDNAEDWLTNLDITTEDISEHNGEAWLHEGFALALDEVYGEIVKILDLKNNPSPIMLTGHSMGAALGTQMAIRLVSRETTHDKPLIDRYDDRLRGAYFFAAPRVGNIWARNILDKYMNRTRNIAVNFHSNADPAPKTPFDWMGYKRAGVQAVIKFNPKDPAVYGDRKTWVCYDDADYRGPSGFSVDLLYSSLEAHYLRSYVKHFVPWRERLAKTHTCENPTLKWGPRFEKEDPAAYKPLSTSSALGLNACDYTAFSWGGNVQL